MNTSPTPRNLSIWLFAAILGAALTLGPASASVDPDRSLQAIDASSLPALQPEASPEISVMTLSQCPSGNFCVWSGPGYEGTLKRFTNQSQYTSIGLNSVGSFYNNRSKRVYVYGNSSGTPSACYGAGVKKFDTSSSNWLSKAKGTYLSTATSC